MGSLLVIAGTSGPFADFSPHAPAINDTGLVAFHATRRSGATGVFCGQGGPIAPLAFKAAYRSQPALNAAGVLAVFAELPDGRPVLLRGTPGAAPDLITHEAIEDVGPMAPSINEAGVVAFRATSATGRAGIYVANGGALTRIAEAGDTFRCFDGQPLMLEDGSAIFRADQADGRQCIFRWRPDAEPACVAATGAEFAELGRFFGANADGTVVFTATAHGGSPGIHRAAGGAVETVFSAAKRYESIRGALVDASGRIVFLATTTGDALALYALDDGQPRRVIGMRDEFGTCPLTDFAFGPASFNNHGQVALRLRLADARQFIARLDVFESP